MKTFSSIQQKDLFTETSSNFENLSAKITLYCKKIKQSNCAEKLNISPHHGHILDGGHHGDPLVVVDHPVPVDVRVEDHLVNLVVLHLLPEVGHDVSQLLRADRPDNNFE